MGANVDAPSKIAERWSERIIARGFTPVPSLLLQTFAELELTPAEALLVIHIAAHQWDKKAPFPSMQRLARLMGVSARYIRKMVLRLEELKLVSRQARSGTSNLFDLSGLVRLLDERAEEQEGVAL